MSSHEAKQREKRRLRRRLKKLRAAVGEKTAPRAARAVGKRVLALPEVASARSLLVCLSFGSELETRGLIDDLLALGKEVYLPRVDPGGDGPRRGMTLHRYPCALERIRFGLEQPSASVPAIDADAPLDVALILGIAFDLDGYRLGYGGGYFDRFLSRRDVLPVGLGYEVQIVDRLPREPHDVPMRIVVTESRLLRTAERRKG